MTQLVGKFPIFGSRGKLGTQADTTGSVIPSDSFPAYYVNNKLAYNKGFTSEPTVEQLNGVLGFITAALSDLYTRGIPRFTLGVSYPKGAVVSFNEHLFVSLQDDNTTHISQTSYWDKVCYLGKDKAEEAKEKATDDLPIGTILTVPLNVIRKGYIDYVEGQEFSTSIYPELYKALGTNRFGIRSSTDSSLPIGSIVHCLSANPNVMNGWIEWDNTLGSLRQYPQLKEELEKMAQRITDPSVKSQWLAALATDSLPTYNGFYLGSGEAGNMLEDTVRQQTIVSAPVVIDCSNTLNPLGVSRCTVEEKTYPVVADGSIARTLTNSPYLVTGIKAETVTADVDKKQFKLIVGNGDVTRPRTLSTRIFVKATNPQPSAISTTHKQIIKAF